MRKAMFTVALATATACVMAAAAFIAGSGRAEYLRSFESAPDVSLAIEILSGLFTARERLGQLAVYDLTRTVDGTPTTSQVVFMLEADGIWRVSQF